MAVVEFERGTLSIDATVIGRGLNVEPSLVQGQMREGKITVLSEQGVDEDAGRYRLTFFYENRRFRLVVDEEGNGRFLRRTFVSRAGHCTFTPAETIAAVGTLLQRLDTGHWPEVDAANLNAAAAALGPNFNIFAAGGQVVAVPPAFIDFKPSRYLRPFDEETEECDSGRRCNDRF